MTVNVTKRKRCELTFPQFFPGELQNKINPKCRFTEDDIKMHIFCTFYLQQEAQKRRGGLSVCLKDAIAAKEFRDLHDKCINSMIKTANAKLPKRPKPPRRPVLGVRKKPLKKQKGRKRPILAKNNRG